MMTKRSGWAIVLIASAAWAGSVSAADTVRGAKLFNTQCSGCHGSDGSGALVGVPNFQRGEGLFKANPELLEKIRNGKGVMPAFKGVLTDAEIQDVIAHLRTLRR